MKKILVLNSGSSTLKYQLFNVDGESYEVVAKGNAERIGRDASFVGIKYANGDKKEVKVDLPDHKTALNEVMKLLTDGVIGNLNEISAIGHRIVQGGSIFKGSVVVTEKVIEDIESLSTLAPLHNPSAALVIRAVMKELPSVPQVVVFDTAFHQTMPAEAYIYALPEEQRTTYKIRRYGAHGTSHKFVAQKAAEIVGEKSKIITCHIGSGASITAVKDGKCIDTSMGLTPLEGLVMGTRSGDLDPAVLEFMMDKTGMNIHEMLNYLNKKSGVDGISGVGSDFRDLVKAYDEGNDRARLAIDMFSYRVKKYIGAYAAALNGLDCIVFTGGIGEHTEIVREKVMKDMEYLGVDFDFEKNNHVGRGNVTELSKPDSKVKVYIIPTNEELVIARETLRLK